MRLHMANREIRFLAHAANGHIDSNTSVDFRIALDRKLDSIQDRAFDFIIDLSEISYMSSMGIRELVRVQQRAQSRGGKVILDMVDERIEDKLRMTGLGSLLPEKPPR